jgi:hypothetical protein
MVMVQAIKDQHSVNRKTEFLLDTLGKDELNHVLKTDEANFLLCGNVNSQNCHYWTT